jgi:hypothetical protein
MVLPATACLPCLSVFHSRFSFPTYCVTVQGRSWPGAVGSELYCTEPRIVVRCHYHDDDYRVKVIIMMMIVVLKTVMIVVVLMVVMTGADSPLCTAGEGAGSGHEPT